MAEAHQPYKRMPELVNLVGFRTLRANREGYTIAHSIKPFPPHLMQQRSALPKPRKSSPSSKTQQEQEHPCSYIPELAATKIWYPKVCM
eukprot:CAMPEP_0169064526 /NCGR_PEP_ID=MMETSP1015-20121227/1885_1 /TAXON_ID=342587 /ORGANISM="Karlodinium micrum, Strain CCMP2283" /LENGTH=88 /DNA_ID=CAMNT_0009122975 /DNA_START=421 /DNA_END=687 /DNA_ORIENTATION=+